MNYAIRIHSYGELNPELEQDLISFLFQPNIENRQDKIDFYKRYVKNSLLITVHDYRNNNIVATVRCILKINPWDLLPVESSTILEVLCPHMSQWFKKGLPFEVVNMPGSLPCSEIGGLKVSDKIPKRDQYKLIYNLFDSCETIVRRLLCVWAIVRCDDTPSFIRLYREKAKFKEMAITNSKSGIKEIALYRLNHDLYRPPK